MAGQGQDPKRIAAALRRVSPGLDYARGTEFYLPEEKLPGGAAKHLFTGRRAIATILLWMVFFINFIFLFFMFNWLPALMQQAGQPIAIAILATVGFNLGGVVGGIVLGLLMDRFGQYPVLGAAYALAAFFVGSIGFVSGSLAFVIVAVVLAGFCSLGAPSSRERTRRKSLSHHGALNRRWVGLWCGAGWVHRRTCSRRCSSVTGLEFAVSFPRRLSASYRRHNGLNSPLPRCPDLQTAAHCIRGVVPWVSSARQSTKDGPCLNFQWRWKPMIGLCALVEGSVRCPDIELDFQRRQVSGPTVHRPFVAEIFQRMIRDKEFDACELGLTYYLRTLNLDEPPFIAIPVFTARF